MIPEDGAVNKRYSCTKKGLYHVYNEGALLVRFPGYLDPRKAPRQTAVALLLSTIRIGRLSFPPCGASVSTKETALLHKYTSQKFAYKNDLSQKLSCDSRGPLELVVIIALTANIEP